MIEISADSKTENARIMVIGVGGCGNNAVNSMVEDGVLGVTYAGLNTDTQVLNECQADHCIQIGKQLTKGLGAGAKPEIGEAAAIESEDDIRSLVRGQDMVIITCGMGGGTGTGAAPVVAKITRELGILTVGVVTRPFQFEAKIRMQNAINGIEKLKQYTDTLIVISNNKLLEIVDRKTTMKDALKKSDMILKQTIQGITDLINRPAMINLDFADVTTIMKDKGMAYIGIGTGHGDDRTIQAVENALSSPLLETSIEGATHVLLNISGDVTLLDADEGASKVQEMVSEEANIIFGSMYDDSEPDTVTVTIIATSVDKNDGNTVTEKQNIRQKTHPAASNRPGMSNPGLQNPNGYPNSGLQDPNEYPNSGFYGMPNGYTTGMNLQQNYGDTGQLYESYTGNPSENGRMSGLQRGNTGPLGRPITGTGMNTGPLGRPTTGAGMNTGPLGRPTTGTGNTAKITEFQSHKEPENELKFSTIQSKTVRTKQQEPEDNYYDAEENSSNFDIPDFLKRIRRKK